MKQRITATIIALMAIVVSAMGQTISVEPIEMEVGSQATLSVGVSGLSDVTALQFNLQLPEGFVLDESAIEKSSAASGHELAIRPLANGGLLFVLYNMDKAIFGNGEILRLPITAGSEAGSFSGKLTTFRTATTDAVSHAGASASFPITVTNKAMTLEVGNVKAKTTDTEVQVPINATKNDGFGSGIITIEWDKDKLELSGVEYSELAPNNQSAAVSNKGTYKIAFGSALTTEDFTGTGTFFTLTFKIPSGSVAGTIPVKIIDTNIQDSDVKDLTVTTKDGGVTLEDTSIPPAETEELILPNGVKNNGTVTHTNGNVNTGLGYLYVSDTTPQVTIHATDASDEDANVINYGNGFFVANGVSHFEVSLPEGYLIQSITLNMKNNQAANTVTFEAKSGTASHSEVPSDAATDITISAINAQSATFTLTTSSGGWNPCTMNYIKIEYVDTNGDEPTGIDAPLNDNGEMINDSWYSVDGVKLQGEPTRKGVYIVNGKKIVK